MKNENSRNTIIFIVCSVLILGIYWFTVLRPQAERRAAQQSAQAEQSQTAENAANTALNPQGPVFVSDRTQALGTAARVPIQSGTLKGSLSLQGALTSGMPQASASNTRMVGMPGNCST